MTVKKWILAAEFAAIVAIFAQLTFPMALIPLTGQTFAVGLTATILDKKTSTWALVLYMLLGLLGLPVFAGMTGGLGILMGPTGGFIVGFVFNTFITSSWLEKFGYSAPQSIVANLLGAMVTLAFGTVWLWLALGTTFSGAVSAGFLPWIIPGIVKGVAAALLGLAVRRALVKAQLLKI